MKKFPTLATREDLDRKFAYLGTPQEGIDVYGKGNQRYEFRRRPDGLLEHVQSYADEICGH